MKKVAIIYGGSKTGGGVDTYLTNIFTYADKKEVQLELISLGDWTLTQELRIMQYGVRVFTGKWWNLVNILRIASYLKKNKFNLIVSSGMVANFYARKVSAISGIPSLVTVHSDWRTDYSGLKKVLYVVFDRPLRFITKRYIAVSKYLKNRLVAEGINPEKIEVAYNGVDIDTGVRSKKHGVSEDKIADDKSHTPYSIPHTTGSLKIGTVGRLHPVKNYGELILAVGELAKEGLDVSLEIAGDGSEREKLEKVIKEHGLGEKVKLLGWVKDLEKTRSGWDMYVQPSITEGFGLAVVEAMMAGLPVVVTPGGALPELVQDGKTGIIARGFGHQELAKAIKELITEPEKIKIIAENGQKHAVGNFGTEKWARNTVEAYKEATK